MLYTYFERPKPNIKINSSALFVLALILFPSYSFSQTQSISIEEAIQLAMGHNAELQVALKKIERQEQLLPSAFSIDKTELFYNNDQNNIAPNHFPIDVWGINQSIKFPTVYGAQRKVLQQRIQLVEDEYELIKLQLIKEVRTKYHEILY